MPDSPDNPVGRRGFFARAAGRLVGPLADFVEKRLPILGPAGDTPPPPQPATTWLRPPGAEPESRFAQLCHRCGRCAEACPVSCIVMLPPDHPGGEGTPTIDPDRAACVACEGVLCTHVCPSGALTPIFDAAAIRMGLAEVYDSLCVRSSGEACTICVDKCPLGPRAIRLVDAGPPMVLEPGCTGCGVCQLYCPTTPKAITIRPL